jgi:hypothetical protein
MRPTGPTDRAEAAWLLRKQGWTFRRIGEALGVSTPRAQQLSERAQRYHARYEDVRLCVLLGIGTGQLRDLARFAAAGGFDAFAVAPPGHDAHDRDTYQQEQTP